MAKIPEALAVTRRNKEGIRSALRPSGAAIRLGCSKNKVYDLIRRGDLHAFRVGNEFRILPEDLDAYIKKMSA